MSRAVLRDLVSAACYVAVFGTALGLLAWRGGEVAWSRQARYIPNASPAAAEKSETLVSLTTPLAQ